MHLVRLCRSRRARGSQERCVQPLHGSLCPGRDWLGSSRFAAGLVLAVLFLVSDDMRPSIGGHYALPEAHTPNLERLMDEGITFARAYIQYSYCSPSRNS
jgi:hypothetical protein|eukprot:COSAG06_NODE_21325_length_761_cov_0.702417_1_plen_100_part_00